MRQQPLYIQNAHIIDPVNGIDNLGEIVVEDGRIAQMGSDCDPPKDASVINADGLVACPGLIDMHVHLRDPGQTHKEDILSGCMAAAAGGFTAVACMPNTAPPLDTPVGIRHVVTTATAAAARVYPVACITRGMKGGELSSFESLKMAGAVAFSDDGRPVENSKMMMEALRQAARCGLPVISHSEELSIIDGGIVNSRAARSLGVKGMDPAGEEVAVAREILLAKTTGCPVHIAHISTATSAAMIRFAKANGVKVTCETAPHYLLLDDRAVLSQDANFRMNPPLRTQEDCAALIEAVADGTIDALATDHAPHTPAEKAYFLTAPNGVVGLETALGAYMTALVHTGKITLARLITLMSCNPAQILGIKGGSLALGQPADITLLSPNHRWTVDPENFLSKSRNTPFAGMQLKGKAFYTIVGGIVTYKA